MSKTTSKVYKVTSRQQLIDLNNDLTNFNLTFNTEGVNADQSPNPNTSYELLVLNQTQLDNKFNEKTKFKSVKGSLGGKLKADSNNFQNYFLILKAKQDCFVKVTTSIEKLDIKENLPTSKTVTQNTSKSTNWSKYIWISVGVLAAVLVGYYFYKKYKTKTKFNMSSNDSVASEASSDFENESISNGIAEKQIVPPINPPKTVSIKSPTPVSVKPPTPTPKPPTPVVASTPPSVVNNSTAAPVNTVPSIFNSSIQLESAAVDSILDKLNS